MIKNKWKLGRPKAIFEGVLIEQTNESMCSDDVMNQPLSAPSFSSLLLLLTIPAVSPACLTLISIDFRTSLCAFQTERELSVWRQILVQKISQKFNSSLYLEKKYRKFVRIVQHFLNTQI